jgi:hypothetical protein
VKLNAVSVLCLFVALISVGCAQQATTASLTQTAGSLRATLELRPFPPRPMEKVTLELTLRDTDDRLIESAEVSFDLSMPGCTMPRDFPTVTGQGKGVYQAQTLLTMAGAWRLDADVVVDGTRETLTFFFATK